MLKFLRDGTKLQVLLKTSATCGNNIVVAMIETGNEMFASLLRQDLFDRFYGLIKYLREDSYNKGWHDAKSKLTKQRNFSGWVD